MIKVNLLRNRGEAATKTGVTDVFETETRANSRVDSAALRGLLAKGTIILIGVIGLAAYESYNIGELNRVQTSKTARKKSLEKEIKEKQVVADKAKVLQTQILDLEARIKAIKDLSKMRLGVIRIVDYIQNIIPERVWLKNLSFTETRLEIEGGAISDEQLNRFIEFLEEKSYFKNVILLRAIEQTSKEGTIKVFSITADLTGAD